MAGISPLLTARRAALRLTPICRAASCSDIVAPVAVRLCPAGPCIARSLPQVADSSYGQVLSNSPYNGKLSKIYRFHSSAPKRRSIAAAKVSSAKSSAGAALLPPPGRSTFAYIPAAAGRPSRGQTRSGTISTGPGPHVQSLSGGLPPRSGRQPQAQMVRGARSALRVFALPGADLGHGDLDAAHQARHIRADSGVA